jgi:acyl carrier protein
MNTDDAAYISEREAILGDLRRLLIDGLELRREPDEIDPDAPLFGSGLGLDSIDAVELVLLIEEHFGVRAEDDVVARANLRTVNSVVDMIIAQRGSARGAA